jgi:acyl dehydratase
MGLTEMAKAGVAAIPGAGSLPFLPGGGGDIPSLELKSEAAPADLDALAKYAHVCGFTLRGSVPATWPHMAAFDLHMRILTSGSFPFGPMGLVHIANEITQHRPIEPGEPLQVSARATGLVSHPKGKAFSLLSEARVGDELVWEERSTMLRRGGGGGGSNPAGGGAAKANANGGEANAEKTGERANPDPDGGHAKPGGVPPVAAWWKLPSDLGARYAAVSGDRNPIHMHSLSAKPFGFPGAIAHGMWTKARCLAAVESLLPDSFTVKVRFGKPIVLPNRVGFTTQVNGEGDNTEIDFYVLPRRGNSTHLTGSIRPVTN